MHAFQYEKWSKNRRKSNGKWYLQSLIHHFLDPKIFSFWETLRFSSWDLCFIWWKTSKKNNQDNTNTWWLLLQVVILLCSCSFRRVKLHSLIPHLLKLSLKCHFLHEDYLTNQSRFTNSPPWLPPCSFCLGYSPWDLSLFIPVEYFCLYYSLLYLQWLGLGI